MKGRAGQVGESRVPWEICWLEEGRNEQQADKGTGRCEHR